ncbi:hypothetical protein BGZ65_007959, partial [Modicella reniformis]
MLDIPELNKLICQQLNKHDLTQCARVNKKWHGNVIPHLWRDINFKWDREENTQVRQKKAFRRVVLEDYLMEQQQQQQGEEHSSMDQHTQGQSSFSLSTLKKYGPWIQTLPTPEHLLLCFNPQRVSTRSLRSSTRQVIEPTALELVRHLYQHCPFFQVPMLPLSTIEEHISDDILKTIEEFVLPRVHTLVLTTHPHNRSELWRLQYMLDRCSSIVELYLNIDISYTEDEKNDNEEEQQQEEHKVWPKLKILSLRKCYDKSQAKVFWPWLWKRCGHVEGLEVGEIGGLVQSLADGMLDHMPKLSDITLGRLYWTHYDLTDKAVATLLSDSRKEWK